MHHGAYQELNEESLSKLSNVYARQIRKGCFMGSGTSLCVLLVVSTILYSRVPPPIHFIGGRVN